jgi:hypothetical protein
MVALVATIHDFFGGAEPRGRQKKAWMVGTRPTMTTRVSLGTEGPNRLAAAHLLCSGL